MWYSVKKYRIELVLADKWPPNEKNQEIQSCLNRQDGLTVIKVCKKGAMAIVLKKSSMETMMFWLIRFSDDLLQKRNKDIFLRWALA